MWRRCAAVLAVVVGVLTVPSVAHADAFAPTVDSVGPAPSATLGGGSQLSVPFVANDQGGSGISSVALVFTNPRTTVSVVARWYEPNNTTSSVSDSVTVLLSPWVASGTWSLARVDVYDRQNNQRHYTPSGQSSDPADGNTSSSIDWSLSFSVNNPLEDITKPRLTSLRMLTQNVIAGTPAILMYTGTDDLSGIAGVWADYTTPRGTRVEIANNNPVTAGVGPATWLVPLSAYGGQYTLNYVDVVDRAGNQRQYGWNADPDDGNDVNTQAGTFTVQPYAEDATAPTLDAITRRSADVEAPGDVLQFDYTAHDDATSIQAADIIVVDPEGHQYDVSRDCTLGGGEHQTAAMRLPDFAVPGTWTVLKAAIMDGQGNVSTYNPDGTVIHDPTSAAGPSQHDLNLSSLTFQVASQPPKPMTEVSELPPCVYLPTVSFLPTVPKVPPGQPVDLNGQVTRDGKPVPNPQVAVYASNASGVQLLDVLQGDTEGAFTEHVVPAHATTYWASFFGQIGPNPATAQDSRPQLVQVAYPTAATIATTTTHLVAGQSVTISGQVLDLSAQTSRVPPVTAELWQRVGTGVWTRAASVTSDGTSLSIPQRPTRSTAYQWRYAGKQFPDTGDKLDATTSPITTVTVAPLVTIHRTATTIARGRTVRIYGTVSPSAIGQYVYLQRLYGSSWKTVASGRITRQRMPNGTYETGYLIRFTPTAAGNYTFRSYCRATSTNTAGASGRATVRVT